MWSEDRRHAAMMRHLLKDALGEKQGVIVHRMEERLRSRVTVERAVHAQRAVQRRQEGASARILRYQQARVARAIRAMSDRPACP